MKYLYLTLGVVLIVDLAITLRRARARKCQRCCRPWAVFYRREMNVCRTCRDEIDHPPNWHPPASRRAA